MIIVLLVIIGLWAAWSTWATICWYRIAQSYKRSAGTFEELYNTYREASRSNARAADDAIDAYWALAAAVRPLLHPDTIVKKPPKRNLPN